MTILDWSCSQLARVNRWLHNNIFFVCLAFVLVYFLQAHSLGNAFRNEEAFAAKSCKSSNARAQAVINFWSDTANFRSKHASHERDASIRWATISSELAKEHVGTNKLHLDIFEVSAKWRELADDDDGNAQLARDYIKTIAADYNTACSDTPPSPQASDMREPT